MKKIKLLLACFCASALLIGCNEDDDSNNNGGPSGSNFEQNFGSTVSRDFIGQVVNTNNQPVVGASVNIGSTTISTDSNGMFFANEISVKDKFAYITVDKAGFFQGSRTLAPTSGKNKVKIMLIPNTPTATVNSGASSEVTTDSGSKIIFDGSFADENGAAYSGTVAVSVFHLKPSDENISSLMPGSLYAERENGNEAALQTFGMLNVELRGSAGQKLQPAEGHPATIEFAIDATQASLAPSSIPLWHFDSAKGWWKEDGIATRQGNKYVGEASHFSWWNCDAPFPTVHLQLTVNDADGNPIANSSVAISFGGNPWPAYGYTDQNGHVSGLVPANETLTVNIFNICNEVAYSSTIGPFSSASSLTITATSGSAQTVLVDGNLIACDGNPVTNGYVMMTYGNNRDFYPVTNGNFSFNTLTCSPNQPFTLRGIDADNLQETGEINYNFTAPQTNIGNLQACTAVDEFISYQIDNDTVYVITQEVNATLGSQGQVNGLTISGYNEQTPTGSASLYIFSQNTNTVGVYSTAQFSLESGQLGYIGNQTTNDLVFNLTHVGAVGEYVDLNFSGTYVGQDGQTHTITGVAHAIRSF
ncbi:carboxypeptidase-like regulatory domain-containing protein [Flavobacterium sp.]|uniref:carboxypeptidase-like regulatory domain-containing protein n=1 Tax=Flavobacterium sp. TaxID=239 RepID=UPI0011FB6C6B|nr:carboxypeptidase-like regulatory domain-containing protein [Flavobacterium sp.]RZJ70242.1 MAG: carboxypeptidase regulatory-like domain-containing protein [Flavobacterium sp.]